jgi:hypothetical protein
MVATRDIPNLLAKNESKALMKVIRMTATPGRTIMSDRVAIPESAF